MSELFLIAHKVRGEPAFDIATCDEVEGETMWIIPTSGHRAYPYWWNSLDTLCQTDLESEPPIQEIVPPMPPDLPDHYRVSASLRTADPTAARNLLSSLGLLKPAEPIKRRI